MEFLNNIGTILNIPNESLITWISIPSSLFIEAPLSLILIINLFNIKASTKQKLLYILLTDIVALITISIIQPPFNVIINYLMSFVILISIFKIGILKALAASVFPGIVFSLLENLILSPYLSILNITYTDVETIPIYRILYTFIMYFIVFIFSQILKFKNITINILEHFDKKNKSIIIFNFIFGILNIFMQMMLTLNYIDILPIGFTFFNFICLLVYFCISFFSLAKIMKLAKTTQKLESAEEYNKTLHILHDNVRGFKHDFDNIVTTIGGYINTNDMKGLKQYYSQLEEDCERVNNLYVLNPDIINNPGIYNLLTTKYHEAEEKNIKINLTFLLDLDDLHMKIYEFTRIIGILLDNAIDSASECDDKIINIIFRRDNKNNRNVIIIENTYKDKNVDLDQIFNKGVSGKENHSGLGLWEVRQIISKNNNLNLHTIKNEKFFTQQLEIYY